MLSRREKDLDGGVDALGFPEGDFFDLIGIAEEQYPKGLDSLEQHGGLKTDDLAIVHTPADDGEIFVKLNARASADGLLDHHATALVPADQARLHPHLVHGINKQNDCAYG